MVDTTEAMESQFVTPDLVKSSPTKKLVVIDPGSYQKTDYGDRLTLGVNLDGKKKLWRPNQESVLNLQIYGKDSVNWTGKVIDVSVEKRSGKEAVIAKPGEQVAQVQEETVPDHPPQQEQQQGTQAA